MKLSKSILSPSHARHEPPLSLPPSLSRRLKANGSIKGGQSPATFPTTTGRKRGSGFDNPEPSSPKVTCIGQVKMKTKKKVRQSHSLSNRRIDNLSFRKVEQAAPEERGLVKSSGVHFQLQDQCAAASATAAAHRNQRWVHLPLTIYEALRDFSCLFPCRSSCFSTNNEKEKEEKVNGLRQVDNNVVARWLVALQDGEAEKMEEMPSTMRSSRRHVFEGIEFKDNENVEPKEESVEEEKGRVSICIPPKNALLLMRCRSDPTKMADITNRFLESPTRKENDEEVEEEAKKEIGEIEGAEELVDAQNFECKVLEETNVSIDLAENEENLEAVEVMEMEIESIKDEEMFKSVELTSDTEQEDEEENEINAHVAAEVNSIDEQVADNRVPVLEKEEESSIQTFSSFSENSIGEFTESENKGKVFAEEDDDDDDDEKFKANIEQVIEETLLLGVAKQTYPDKKEAAKYQAISDSEKNEIEKEDMNVSILPDCLLLMMYEPKLSMEVSKETWVCSSNKNKKKEIFLSEEPNKSQHLPPQPPRSSCSFPATAVPAAMSMATMIEQKLLGTSMSYEPFVLTRCKSEPMRMAAAAAAAAKVAPETCFWKNRKIEPHRQATFGFGAAGVGF